MTKEDAIKRLKEARTTIQPFRYVDEAIDYAIKALEQESCEDAISRQEAVEAFQMFREYESNRSNKGWVDRIETVLNQLPPVNPQNCDKCEFVNPCLYCRHEFEPQESERV